MLGDFVRLADYIAVEALVSLTIKTNENLLAELLKPRKAGLFETTVLFTDEGTAFTPTCEDIKVCGCMTGSVPWTGLELTRFFSSTRILMRESTDVVSAVF